jgi:hypothetical protein
VYILLNEQCHEIFNPRVFFIKQSPFDPDSQAEAVSHMTSYSPRKSIQKSPLLDPAVSMTPQVLTFMPEFPFNIMFSSNYM